MPKRVIESPPPELDLLVLTLEREADAPWLVLLWDDGTALLAAWAKSERERGSMF